MKIILDISPDSKSLELVPDKSTDKNRKRYTDPDIHTPGYVTVSSPGSRNSGTSKLTLQDGPSFR